MNWVSWFKRQLHQIFKNGEPTRLVSTTVFTKNAKNPSRVNTALLMSMGQFIDHDLTHVPMRSKYSLNLQKCHKVHILWEGRHLNLRKSPYFVWNYFVASKIVWTFQNVQSISFWNGICKLALTDKDMQVRFGIRMVLYCWDREFLGTTTIFQKK